jgi:DNA-binding transcriptional MerR regulator
MQLEEFLNFINNSTFLNQVELSKIPNINLYMDQALTFMNENLYQRNPQDKTLTKSMINNYVKNNLIPKPENKKYFPQHIIALIYIFYMKQILSLDDVKSICNSYTDEHFKFSDMSNLYNIFLTIESEDEKKLENEIKALASSLYSNKSCENFDDNEKLFLLISLLSSRANIYKTMIEKLLDDKSDNNSIKK